MATANFRRRNFTVLAPQNSIPGPGEYLSSPALGRIKVIHTYWSNTIFSTCEALPSPAIGKSLRPCVTRTRQKVRHNLNWSHHGACGLNICIIYSSTVFQRLGWRFIVSCQRRRSNDVLTSTSNIIYEYNINARMGTNFCKKSLQNVVGSIMIVSPRRVEWYPFHLGKVLKVDLIPGQV